MRLPTITPSNAAKRVLVSLWCVALAMLCVGIDAETDAFWTAREGLDLLSGGTLVHPDRWSWAPMPHDYVPNSTAWQWILGFAWSGLGRGGLMVVAFVSNLLCFLALAKICGRLGARELSITFSLIGLSVLDAAVLVNRSTLPAFVWLLVGIDAFWRLGPCVRSWARFYALPAISTATGLWVFVGLYLHNSWVLWSVILIASVAVWTRLHSGLDALEQLLFPIAAAVGTAAAISVGPLGIAVLPQAFRVVDQVSGANLEWIGAFDRGVRWTLVCLAAILAGAMMMKSQWVRRKTSTGSLQLVLALGLTLGAVAGLVAIRFLFLALLCGAPLLAVSGSGWAVAHSQGALVRRLGERATAAYWRPVMAAAGALVIPLALVQSATAAYPSLADTAVAAIPRDCRLFADESSAAILLRPDVLVWWDGREDYWGRARWNQGLRYLAGAETKSAVPDGTSCVLLHENLRDGTWPPLASLLASSPRWKLAASATSWRIWVPTDQRLMPSPELSAA